MGELGKQIAGKGRAATVQQLTRAYADEWFAHYNYELAANTLRGHHSPSTVELLHRKSKEAFDRTRRLLSRIQELGGRAVYKWPELIDQASDKPFKLPRSMTDVDGVLKAVLDAERTSIRTYQTLQKLAGEADPVTELIGREFLTAAVQGEEELERLLGDSAPGMTGK